MLRSMTGFGRYLLEEENWTQIWEIRSVNNRYLDIRWRLPNHVRAVEGSLEKVVKQHAARGRLEISLYLQMHTDTLQQSEFNHALASTALNSLQAFAHSRNEDFEPNYNLFLSSPAFWIEEHQELDELMGKSLEKGLEMALADWNESRSLEGKALAKDMATRLLHIEEWVARIEERAPEIKEERFSALRERITGVLEQFGQELDEGRFLQESTYLADKLDVSEELTRLLAHLERLRDLLETGKDAGRKMDFTMQEIFREITTCGNKIQDIQVARLVVDIKNELEKCREQVQNIE